MGELLVGAGIMLLGVLVGYALAMASRGTVVASGSQEDDVPRG